MLDLARLARIHLAHRPYFQHFMGGAVLEPLYRFLPGVDIRFEGYENVERAGGPVIFAMNHTDRFNYFPFQWYLWRHHDGFTTAWVKGKYYEIPAVSHFLEASAQLPVPSRGYLIARDFQSATGRKPTPEEYELIRHRLDALMRGELPEGTPLPPGLPASLQGRSRDMLGVEFIPTQHDYFSRIRDVFGMMMDRFVALNEEALEKDLNLIVFPQGTRSIRLTRGQIGIAQIALHLGVPVIPVGCNGSDLCYPGNNPFPKKGQVIYRFGEAITREEMARFQPSQAWKPFHPADEWRHREHFQGFVDALTLRINELLDPCYQLDPDGESETAKGMERFL